MTLTGEQPWRILVYGAGVLGSQYAVRLHDAGHAVTLVARGDRRDDLVRHGVRIQDGAGPVRHVVLPIVQQPTGAWDLVLVLVRAHQVEGVLESLLGIDGDVLFLQNWAAGAAPLQAAIGPDRVLLGFPTLGAGTLHDGIVRPRPSGVADRFARMPIGDPSGQDTPRLRRLVRIFDAAGIRTRVEPRIDAWLQTHAAFEVPLGQAVHEAGGTRALAADRDAVPAMVRRIRGSLGALPDRPVPAAFGVIGRMPDVLLVAVLRRFLRSRLSSPLDAVSPATAGEYDRLALQLAARRADDAERA